MAARAQTNLQLFAELRASGCPPAELRRVRDAYLLGMRLYSGMYTGCGRPTIAHEVGTASLALRHGGSWDHVVAGLLHGAYAVGDWGHFRVRITPRKRAQLRAAIGAASESMVYGFWSQNWHGGALVELARRAASLDELERDVAFLRLVEELDRLEDDGALVCFRDPARMREYFTTIRQACRVLAEHLGKPDLGQAIDDAIEALLRSDPPAEVMGWRFPGEWQRVVQPSYRRRLGLRVYQSIAGRGRRAERRLRDWLAARAPLGPPQARG